MSKDKQLDGYDYNARKGVSKTRKEWKAEIQLVYEGGGRKARCSNGDLLLIMPIMGTHKIIAEVYGY